MLNLWWSCTTFIPSYLNIVSASFWRNRRVSESNQWRQNTKCASDNLKITEIRLVVLMTANQSAPNTVLAGITTFLLSLNLAFINFSWSPFPIYGVSFGWMELFMGYTTVNSLFISFHISLSSPNRYIFLFPTDTRYGRSSLWILQLLQNLISYFFPYCSDRLTHFHLLLTLLDPSPSEYTSIYQSHNPIYNYFNLHTMFYNNSCMFQL
jgi:hypothetical protein